MNEQTAGADHLALTTCGTKETKSLLLCQSLGPQAGCPDTEAVLIDLEDGLKLQSKKLLEEKWGLSHHPVHPPPYIQSLGCWSLASNIFI